MRDLYEDGGAISVRGCRLEPSHRDAGSPTGSSAHLRSGSGERPTCSSTGITGGRYDMGRQSRTHTGLLRPSAWVSLAWIDQAMHTATSRGRGTSDLHYAQRFLLWMPVSSNGTLTVTGAPVTDHSTVDAVAIGRAQSTIWMPPTCLGSMRYRGRLVRAQHTSDFQDPQMYARYVPTGPGGD